MIDAACCVRDGGEGGGGDEDITKKLPAVAVSCGCVAVMAANVV